jgi:hypothetical protein
MHERRFSDTRDMSALPPILAVTADIPDRQLGAMTACSAVHAMQTKAGIERAVVVLVSWILHRRARKAARQTQWTARQSGSLTSPQPHAGNVTE